MTTIFYISAAVAIVATAMVITRRNAVHALLYLIVSLLAVAVVFFMLGAPFVAGAGGHRLRRRHHGAVRLRDHDAQPRPAHGRSGKPLAHARHLGRAGLLGPILLVEVALICARSSGLQTGQVQAVAQRSRPRPVRHVPAGRGTGVDAAAGGPGRRVPPGPPR